MDNDNNQENRIELSDTGTKSKKNLLPIFAILGVLIFGICAFFFLRPSDKNTVMKAWLNTANDAKANYEKADNLDSAGKAFGKALQEDGFTLAFGLNGEELNFESLGLDIKNLGMKIDPKNKIYGGYVEDSAGNYPIALFFGNETGTVKFGGDAYGINPKTFGADYNTWLDANADSEYMQYASFEPLEDDLDISYDEIIGASVEPDYAVVSEAFAELLGKGEYAKSVKENVSFAGADVEAQKYVVSFTPEDVKAFLTKVSDVANVEVSEAMLADVEGKKSVMTFYVYNDRVIKLEEIYDEENNVAGLTMTAGSELGLLSDFILVIDFDVIDLSEIDLSGMDMASLYEVATGKFTIKFKNSVDADTQNVVFGVNSDAVEMNVGVNYTPSKTEGNMPIKVDMTMYEETISMDINANAKIADNKMTMDIGKIAYSSDYESEEIDLGMSFDILPLESGGISLDAATAELFATSPDDIIMDLQNYLMGQFGQ